MAEILLCPYIARGGDAKQMLEFYHEVLGGEIHLSNYGENPGGAPEGHEEQILHGRVDATGITIMAADAPPNMPKPGNESNVSLSLVGEEEDRLKKVFEALSKGGNITMPLEKQFWGDTFGMVDDKFGTHWMVNIGSTKPQAQK
jgi:PhnB protein